MSIERKTPFEKSNKSEIKGRRQYFKQLSVARLVFDDFADNTTVHGLKYVGDKKLHSCEKAFWIIAICLSILVCFTMIFQIYDKFRNTPVIITNEEKSTSVWNIPFPAITICPQTKTIKNLFDFTKTFKMFINKDDENLTRDELRHFEAVAQICNQDLIQIIDLEIQLDGDEIIQILDSLATNDSILISSFKNKNKELTKIITNEGFCYTFNTLNKSELFRENVSISGFINEDDNDMNWALENGYNDSTNNSYPNRGLGAGEDISFYAILQQAEADFDYLCRGIFQGYKIYLHLPSEIPIMSDRYFRVPLRREVHISVRPEMIVTSPKLKSYKPDDRKCYFDNERNLKFFKTYTESNCKYECFVNFTLAACKCVKFFMPHDENTRICKHDETQCYVEARNNFAYSTLNKPETECICLQSCTSIYYDADIYQNEFDYENALKAYGENLDEYEGKILSSLVVYFKDSHFVASRRSELYGISDFISNFGGLLGLFMGVSIISIMEIFYYITIRLTYYWKNDDTEKEDEENSASEIKVE